MAENRHPLKARPKGARQHATAGPYSPVLEVDAARLVVISGQVAVDMSGAVVGATIEEQTRATLENCAGQLASAGCTLGDVFKVNIYLTDLGEWSRFNAVYEEMMPEPLPVRTAVQAVLLPGFRVEIEMWAVKAKD
jgi:2-iminobutanoate/2-iminopropanoate deaminase